MHEVLEFDCVQYNCKFSTAALFIPNTYMTNVFKYVFAYTLRNKKMTAYKAERVGFIDRFLLSVVKELLTEKLLNLY